VVRKLLERDWNAVVATKDWHPSDHGSFAAIYGKQPGEKVMLGGVEQILWPIHCVQNTPGAEFKEGWDHSKVDKIFHKGIDKEIDSYSTFFDNGHRRSTGLADYLRNKGVNEVYLVGLATDYCVKYSALDACHLGFKVYVIKEGCRAVNLQEGDEERALEEMQAAGAQVIGIDQL